MSENMVAIRCKSETNRWMDSVMIVPQERANDIEQSIKERMRGFERNGSCYGDVMREIAQAAGIESLALCDYDEDTDEPTDAWSNTARASARRCLSSRLTSVSWGTT